MHTRQPDRALVSVVEERAIISEFGVVLLFLDHDELKIPTLNNSHTIHVPPATKFQIAVICLSNRTVVQCRITKDERVLLRRVPFNMFEKKRTIPCPFNNGERIEISLKVIQPSETIVNLTVIASF